MLCSVNYPLVSVVVCKLHSHFCCYFVMFIQMQPLQNVKERNVSKDWVCIIFFLTFITFQYLPALSNNKAFWISFSLFYLSFHTEMSFYPWTNITHFLKNDWVKGLIFKEVQNNNNDSEMSYILFAEVSFYSGKCRIYFTVKFMYLTKW